MTNFTAPDFEQIWLNMQLIITNKYNKGRGMRSKVTGKENLLMLLVVTKHGGHLYILGKLFNIKSGTFERMNTRFASLISSHIYEESVIKLTQEYTMPFLHDSNSTFKNHPEALYAVDVIFQQYFRPSGAFF